MVTAAVFIGIVTVFVRVLGRISQNEAERELTEVFKENAAWCNSGKI